MIQVVSKLIKKLLKSFSKKLFLVKIEGLSAFPELIPGKYYLAQNLWQPKIGQYVVFLFQKRIVVKKLIARNNDILVLQGKIGQEKYSVQKRKVLGTLIGFSKFSL